MEDKPRSSRTSDILDLLVLIQSKVQGVSLSEIQEQFAVSRRTAERMRDMIVSRFIQTQEIEGDNRQKRWRIPQGTLKDFIQFSADDLACLNLAKDILEKNHITLIVLSLILALLIASYFIIDAVIAAIPEVTEKPSYELMEGESLYAGVPVAYPRVSESQMTYIYIDNKRHPTKYSVSYCFNLFFCYKI